MSPDFYKKYSSGNALITIIWCLFVLTFSITFALFFSLHTGKELVFFDVKQIPTLSLTGSYMPELVVLTSGLHIFAFLSFYFFTIVWRVYRIKIRHLQAEYSHGQPPQHDHEHVETASERYVSTVNTAEKCCYSACACCWQPAASYTPLELQGINDGLWWVGLVFSLAMFLTGSVPMLLQMHLHGAFAFIMFAAGVAHVCVFSLTIAKRCRLRYLPFFSSGSSSSSANSAACLGVFGVTHRQKNWHRTSFYMAIPLNLLLLVSAGVVFSACKELHCTEFSVQTAVVCEYVTALALLFYLEGFRSVEFQNTHFTAYSPYTDTDTDTDTGTGVSTGTGIATDGGGSYGAMGGGAGGAVLSQV